MRSSHPIHPPASNAPHPAPGCRMQPPSVNHPKFFELSISDCFLFRGVPVRGKLFMN